MPEMEGFGISRASYRLCTEGHLSGDLMYDAVVAECT